MRCKGKWHNGSGIKQSELRKVLLTLPPIDEQRAIAHILGTLDDKIELNRRMNETLEAMARALFKSWFVDFDPVRAKAEGRDPGLPQPLADLFPDRFEDSELGEIPEGWEVRSLDEVARFLNGFGVTEDTRSEDGPIATGHQDCRSRIAVAARTGCDLVKRRTLDHRLHRRRWRCRCSAVVRLHCECVLWAGG